MDWKLELVVVPVSEQAGFDVQVDRRVSEDFRVVQLTPPGSVQGLHLIVSDIDVARAELVGRGTDVSEIFHFDAGGQVSGPDPQRATTGLSFPSAIPTATAGSSRKCAAPSRGLTGSITDRDGPSARRTPATCPRSRRARGSLDVVQPPFG